ncbi:MAG: non-hydrolyzing UDP-N-acetylglucosamine 2-epimerase [Omnitrophica WOR_2 bacterium]
MAIRVLSVFGTRPEAVKMAPIVRLLKCTPGVESQVCVTAQHRQMLDQVLEAFQIVPDLDLDLMRPDQSLPELTASIFTHLDPVFVDLRPDWILIQGDTTTVMAASLLAYYRRIRVGHVEAGLRTGDKWQPFPEEINRRVSGVVADLHFAPTEWARQNLLREGVDPGIVRVTGNPVVDALQYMVKRPPERNVQELLDQIGLSEDKGFQGPLDRVESSQHPRLILVTAHRRENFGAPLENICAALRSLAETYGDRVRIVYPVHLNPNVQEPVYRLLGNIPNIHLLPPLDYLPLVQMLKRATLVLTDSGGIQEEAPCLGVPVLVMRQVTERPEGIQAGTAKLVGTDTHTIVSETRWLLENRQAYTSMAHAANPYGDGHAAERIVAALLEHSNQGDLGQASAKE